MKVTLAVYDDIVGFNNKFALICMNYMAFEATEILVKSNSSLNGINQPKLTLLINDDIVGFQGILSKPSSNKVNL